MCDEHALANELALESSEWAVTEEFTGGWLRVAQAWGLEDLERLALHAHESAREGFLKADTRAELAAEIADAPRKSRREKIADLTSEEDERLRRLIRRSDSFNNAYTALEDAPEGTLRPEHLRRTLATLAEERDRAHEEAHRYQEELGLRPE